MKKRLQTAAVLALGAALALGTAAIARHFMQPTMGSDDFGAASLDAAIAKQPKQLWTCGMHPQVVQDHPGNCPICHMKLTPMHGDGDNRENPSPKKLLYWWDPMLGPSSISDKPGKSAMGMDLVPVYGESSGPGVHIDPTVVQNMGVRTAEVTRGPLTKSIRSIGVLRSPEAGLFDVSVKVAGWIDKLDADEEGMHVGKGDVLFELYSPDLQVAEEELIAAVKAEHSLAADAAASVRSEARELVQSAKRKLELWDVADEDIAAIAMADHPPRDIPFRSPASGHLIEKAVVQGTAVQPGMKLMRIEDHTTMWLDAQVYEDQFALVENGQKIVATLDALPGKSFAGTITFISPHLDHMTRTMTVRATLENPGFQLRPGMYTTAVITTRPLNNAIQIPREAVIDTGAKQIVFVDRGQGHFDPRSVRMGMLGDDDQVQIIQGLSPGERVVTSGQFLMDVESRTTEAIDKLRRASTPADPMNPPSTQTAP